MLVVVAMKSGVLVTANYVSGVSVLVVLGVMEVDAGVLSVMVTLTALWVHGL